MANKSKAKKTTSTGRPRVGETTYRRKKAAPPTAPTTLNRQRNRYGCGGKLKK